MSQANEAPRAAAVPVVKDAGTVVVLAAVVGWIIVVGLALFVTASIGFDLALAANRRFCSCYHCKCQYCCRFVFVSLWRLRLSKMLL